MAAYAARVSKCDASISDTLAHGVSCGGVTLRQVTPPLRVTWMSPSSVPAQMIFSLMYDGAIV
jgi:hypothetical protein